MLRRNKVNPTEKPSLGKNSAAGSSNEVKPKTTGDSMLEDTDTEETDLPTPTCYGTSSSWYTGSALDPADSSFDASDSDATFNRSNVKSLSKSKRVKNYIHKKYKDVANTLGNYAGVVGGGSGGDNNVDNKPACRSVDRQRRLTTSWYVDSGVLLDEENNCVRVGDDDCSTQETNVLNDDKNSTCGNAVEEQSLSNLPNENVVNKNKNYSNVFTDQKTLPNLPNENVVNRNCDNVSTEQTISNLSKAHVVRKIDTCDNAIKDQNVSNLSNVNVVNKNCDNVSTEQTISNLSKVHVVRKIGTSDNAIKDQNVSNLSNVNVVNKNNTCENICTVQKLSNISSEHDNKNITCDNIFTLSNRTNEHVVNKNIISCDNITKSSGEKNINIEAVNRLKSNQSFGEDREECTRFIDNEDEEDEDDDDDDDNATITNEDEQVESMSCSSISLAADSESSQDKPSDLEYLVDKHLSKFYPNYSRTRAVLVRQARDLLVCEFGGDLARFGSEFVLPAAELLLPYLDAIQTRGGSVGPLGWPTSLGDSGLVLHLGELPAAQLRARDVHLCLTARPVQLAAVYWMGDRCRRITTHLPDTPLAAMELDNLPELLHDLVVTVDREIERIPLEDLAFPCRHGEDLTFSCRQDVGGCCSATTTRDSCCSATVTRDSCMQTCPTYEMDSSIPHIDSDEDDVTKEDSQRTPVNGSVASIITKPSLPTYQKSKHHVSTGTSTTNGYSYSKRASVTHITTPKSISELPEGIVSESGVYLPGLKDVNGRAIIVYDMNTASNTALTARDVAKLLLYYSSIPLRLERTSSGMCLVIVETINSSSSSNACSTAAAITSVDHHKKLLSESLALIMPSQLKISALLYCQNNNSSSTTRSSLLRLLNISSDIKCHVVSNAVELSEHLAEDQIPSACGGKSDHDQENWIKFFKSVEDFSTRCESCGRRLVSLIGGGGEAGGGTTRRQAHLQHRATARLLADADLQSLRRDAPATLKQLRDTALWLPHSEDVRLWVERAEKLYKEVDRAVQRLEALSEKRREKLRELARMRALEDETSEVLSWISEKGEDCLKRHAELATTLPAIKQQELDFEKFYFISMYFRDSGLDRRRGMRTLLITEIIVNQLMSAFSYRNEPGGRCVELCEVLYKLVPAASASSGSWLKLLTVILFLLDTVQA
ncbi:hypothetical protein LSTR_LSTR010392 [Laodelphax striatellus]|uniref:CRAL-TRIO domain-containing protein n=1 Tax=Laodelphax striatellus TaxID=195883 RepID=A0A482XJM6_LAOST|nr:hypothetical protein LSTR_LSTR010392 [Laodelphax striatellus]